MLKKIKQLFCPHKFEDRYLSLTIENSDFIRINVISNCLRCEKEGVHYDCLSGAFLQQALSAAFLEKDNYKGVKEYICIRGNSPSEAMGDKKTIL